MTSNDPVWPLLRHQVSPLKAASTVTKLIPAVGNAVPFGIQHGNAIRTWSELNEHPQSGIGMCRTWKFISKIKEAKNQYSRTPHFECIRCIHYQLIVTILSNPRCNRDRQWSMESSIILWRTCFTGGIWTAAGFFLIQIIEVKACSLLVETPGQHGKSGKSPKVTTKWSMSWMDVSWYVPVLLSIVWQFQYSPML